MPSPLAPLSGLVSGLLDRSRAGFRWLKPDKQALTVGVVVFVTLATTLGIVALGAAFDATIDREVTVDNPDYPPESTCETFGEDGDSVFVEQCDRPERIDVDVGEELRSASGEYVGYALIGVPIWWAIFALALHGGARASLGIGSLGDSFAIAAWAIAAEVVARLVAGLGAIWYVLATTTVEGTTMESIATEIVAAISTMQGPLLVASAVVISVQWVVVVGGLEAYHDLDRGSRGQSRASSRCSGSCSQRCEGRPEFEFLTRSGSLSRHDPVGRGHPRPPRGGDLVVEPLDDVDQQVQPASVDLRLGERFLEFQRTNIPCIHPTEADEVGDYVTETRVPEGEEFILHPGDFVLGTTTERVEIPPDLLATVQGRSVARATRDRHPRHRGIVDPGYKGDRSRSNCRTSAPRPSRSRPGCASHSSSSRSSNRPQNARMASNAARSIRTRTARRPPESLRSGVSQ